MKRLLKNSLIFLIPFIGLLLFLVVIDLYKLFGFQDYYTDEIIEINRGMITTKTYTHFNKTENYNAFIFGSSRSQAFKCKNWKAYLPQTAVPFHFDASSEGVWGIEKKMKFIDKQGGSIQHALLILDRATLTKTTNKPGPLYIASPKVSNESYFEYYRTFINACLDSKLIPAYFEYRYTNKFKPYMQEYILQHKYPHTANTKTCDIWYGYDKEIKEDSTAYYQEKIDSGLFYNREKKDFKYFECPVTKEEITQLTAIKNLFDKHQTNYKIVIAPIYEQIPLEATQVTLLDAIFGKEHIYNFSGKNQLTEPISNYYEISHFRPHVANIILEKIHSEKKQ